tara:strand:+ start:100 stop:543 length:444 start_codon:yes stop_codon:yes gene_type:complete
MAFKMKGSAFKLNSVATKSALKQYIGPVKKANTEYLESQTATADDVDAMQNPDPNQSKAYLNTKQTQKALTRREINKKLKEEKKFQLEQRGQNKRYGLGKVPNIFSSRAKKEKYLNARDEHKKDRRSNVMSREDLDRLGGTDYTDNK